MQLRYTLEDAHRWRDFSGDDNPIHFSQQKAIAAGLPALSVHGMRALLDMKHVAAQLPNPCQNNEWRRCTLRLRLPLWCDQNYEIQPCDTPGRARLINSQRQNCISLSLRTTLPVEDVPESWFPLSKGEMQANAVLFPAPLAQCRGWNYLDAVLFRQLLTSSELNQALQKIMPELQQQSLNAAFERLLVIQTHHEVDFSPELLTPAAQWRDITNLRFGLLAPVIIGDFYHNSTIALSQVLYHADRPILKNTLTLKTASL